MLKRLALPPDAPNLDRETLWKLLESEKARDSMRPVPLFGLSLSKIITTTPADTNHEFVDQYNTTAFNRYLHGPPFRFTNATLLQDFYAAYLDFMCKPRRGKRSNADKAEIDIFQQRFDKYRIGESRAQAIDSALAARMPTHPSKRLRRKQSDEAKMDDIVEVKMTYHYTLGSLIRTRRHSDTSGAQGCPRMDF